MTDTATTPPQVNLCSAIVTKMLAGWPGLKRLPNTVTPLPRDQWARQRDHWKAYEQVSRELFGGDVTAPRVLFVVGLERACVQLLCSRDDDVMVATLMQLIDAPSRDIALQFAERFIEFIRAERPVNVA